MVTSNEYIQTMRQFTGAVNLITTGTVDDPYGLTASAVMSLTAEPPQIAVAIQNQSATHKAVQEFGCFSVNTLQQGHVDLASIFSRSGIPPQQKFSHGQWDTLVTGAPILVDSLVSFDCTVQERVDFSSHTLFVGMVNAIRSSDIHEPLLYVNGSWATPLKLVV